MDTGYIVKHRDTGTPLYGPIHYIPSCFKGCSVPSPTPYNVMLVRQEANYEEVLEMPLYDWARS